MTNESRLVNLPPTPAWAMDDDKLREALDDLIELDREEAIDFWMVDYRVARGLLQAAPAQPEASTTNSAEISRKLVDHPAHTHCENCGCTWLDDGLNPVGCPYCKPEAERLAVCEWRHIENEGAWASGCGEYWMFTDGGPAENRYKFCHGCGKPVRVKGESDA